MYIKLLLLLRFYDLTNYLRQSVADVKTVRIYSV